MRDPYLVTQCDVAERTLHARGYPHLCVRVYGKTLGGLHRRRRRAHANPPHAPRCPGRPLYSPWRRDRIHDPVCTTVPGPRSPDESKSVRSSAARNSPLPVGQLLKKEHQGDRPDQRFTAKTASAAS